MHESQLLHPAFSKATNLGSEGYVIPLVTKSENSGRWQKVFFYDLVKLFSGQTETPLTLIIPKSSFKMQPGSKKTTTER